MGHELFVSNEKKYLCCSKQMNQLHEIYFNFSYIFKITCFWTAHNDNRTTLLILFMLDAVKLTHEVYKSSESFHGCKIFLQLNEIYRFWSISGRLLRALSCCYGCCTLVLFC